MFPSRYNGYCTRTRRTHGAANSQVNCEHSFTMFRSSCQPVGSPVMLPIMKPTSGHPIRIVKMNTAA
jgi:hypothetical protein